MRRPAREVRVAFAGDRRALAPATVRRVVNRVLDGEGIGEASLDVTFLSSGRMRGLNRRTFGRDRSTDVIAFPMSHASMLVGDVYVCPAAARRSARGVGVPVREELLRLVVHGVLHVAGYDHGDEGREASPMWAMQEEYVKQFLEGNR